MKKTINLLALVAVVAMAFVSCEKVGDDIYFPKTKLVSMLDEDGEGITLTYSDKYISSINYDGTQISVKYNDDDQISELTSAGADGKVVMTYEKKKINKVEYRDNNGNSIYYLVFNHNDAGQISSVKTYGSLDFKRAQWEALCQNKLFASVFDVRPIQAILKANTTKGEISFNGEEFWSYSGNNVATTSQSYESSGYTVNILTTYTYDENPNPLYGLPYAVAQIFAYNANNVLTMSETTTIGSFYNNTEMTRFTYTYNGDKYPATAIESEDTELGDIVYYTYKK